MHGSVRRHPNPPAVSASAGQLQKKFKHAADFGVDGTYNPARARQYHDAIRDHVERPSTVALQGTYRRQPVVHHVDPSTGVNVITMPDGTLISGWKLNPAQLQNLLTHGNL